MKSSIGNLGSFADFSIGSFTLPVQRHAQSACAEYIPRVCDFAEQSSDDDPGAAMTCEQTHQLYAALTTPESEQTCRDAFDATKQVYRQMTPLYASLGLVVPGSCRYLTRTNTGATLDTGGIDGLVRALHLNHPDLPPECAIPASRTSKPLFDRISRAQTMYTHYYFAYGSNLNLPQMTQRCPGHRIIGRAVARGYALAFTGYSRHWGGAVATIAPVENAAVEGVVYAVTEEHVTTLDRFEGHPDVYRQQSLEVLLLGASNACNAHALPPGNLEVMTYIRPLLEPLPGASGYVDVIREGYLAHGLHVPTLNLAATGRFPHRGAPPHGAAM